MKKTICIRCGREKNCGRKHCNSCNVTLSRKKRAKKVREHFGGKCTLCGYSKCLEALEFHHRDPTQKNFTISNGGTKAIRNIIIEAEKCIMVCANCHREIHTEKNVQTYSSG